MYADHHGIPTESDADVSGGGAGPRGRSAAPLECEWPGVGAERCWSFKVIAFKAVKSRISRSEPGLTPSAPPLTGCDGRG